MQSTIGTLDPSNVNTTSTSTTFNTTTSITTNTTPTPTQLATTGNLTTSITSNNYQLPEATLPLVNCTTVSDRQLDDHCNVNSYDDSDADAVHTTVNCNLSNQSSLESNDGYLCISSTGSTGGSSSCEASTTKSINNLISTEYDSGFWAWMVVLGSFLTNGLIFGLINSYGVLFDLIKEHFKTDSGRDNFWTSSIGSLAVGMTFFCSFISSILCELVGIRKTAVFGAIIATFGMAYASFASSLIHIWLAYGILFGFGASLVYTPSLVILGHYFNKRLGLVNGVVTSGSSLFSIFMSFGLNFLVKQMTFQQVFLVLTGFISLLILCALTFIERKIPFENDSSNNDDDEHHHHHHHHTNHASDLEKDLSTTTTTTSTTSPLKMKSIWNNQMYLIWVIAVPVGLFGYFIPYFNLVRYFKTVDASVNEALPVVLMSACSGFGRLIFGNIADSPNVNAVFLQQIAFVSIGVLTLFLIIAHDAFAILVICAGLGLFDGCFISVLGPIAYSTVGQAGASKAVGFLLAACSIPLTVGPMIGGYLIDLTSTYSYVFLYAGIPPIIGAIAMMPMLRGLQCRNELMKMTKANNKSSNKCNSNDVHIERHNTQGFSVEDKPLLNDLTVVKC